jgi:predicted adenylyl cyclase CyaB
MPRNIEIKARIASIEELLPRVARLADRGPEHIEQDDTFFACANGRLKLRTQPGCAGELIYYRRDDESGPKQSFYLRSAVTTPDILRESLSMAYGEAGRLRKHRVLFHRGRTRIHLDRVAGLGDFLELEVVLADDEDPDAGMREARDLLARFGIDEEQLVAGAYVDLIARRA